MLDEKINIELSDNPVTNIQMMAPLLTEKQQYIVFGMILAQVGNKAQKSADQQIALQAAGR